MQSQVITRLHSVSERQFSRVYNTIECDTALCPVVSQLEGVSQVDVGEYL